MRTFFYRRRFIFIPFAAAAFLSLISLVVMNLWNYLLPGILHVGAITFWQAMGIFILCKILFGFGNKGGRFGRGGSPWMRHRMEERFKHMSDEDKEKFKERIRRHACRWDKWDDGHKHPFHEHWDKFAADAEKATE